VRELLIHRRRCAARFARTALNFLFIALTWFAFFCFESAARFLFRGFGPAAVSSPWFRSLPLPTISTLLDFVSPVAPCGPLLGFCLRCRTWNLDSVNPMFFGQFLHRELVAVVLAPRFDLSLCSRGEFGFHLSSVLFA
jgi:hypothetical protein